MNKKVFFLTMFFVAVVFGIGRSEGPARPSVTVLYINDAVINPVIHEYIREGIRSAEAEKAQCLIIELDTPGGLLQSTREIVRDIMNSSVPVVTYIAPRGARAGSAGVFITLASHIAAMAPSTNIGAAHPVGLGGDGGTSKQDLGRLLRKAIEKKKSPAPGTTKDDEKAGAEPEGSILSEKIMNDTVAWIRSIAHARGRNEAWAAEAVEKSVSQTDEEALRMNIIDIIAEDIPDLLKQLNGREVALNEHTKVTLNLTNAIVHDMPLSLRERILLALSHPNIAYILMMLGFYGLLFEVTHPGIGFPGIAGVICLVLGFYSLSLLPVNYAGLLLIILGIILFVAEAHVASYGLLTLGGLVCLVLGSLFLINSEERLMRVSLTVIAPFVLTTAGITLVMVSAAVRAHRRRSVTGRESFIGAKAVADQDFEHGKGTVLIHGEIWQARSGDMIKKEDEVQVKEVQGLELVVEKMKF